jgi:hypothetical protein
MLTRSSHVRLALVLATILSAHLLRAAVLQVGTGGGTTAPGAWTSGSAVSNAFTALTVNPSNFGALYDSASGTVGGGTVAGHLYYAFTARSLDRAGDTRLPTNSVAGFPYGPGTSFAGGQLVGAAPSLNVSQAYGNYAFGYNIGTNGSGPSTFFNTPRVDLAPARVALFEVHVQYNASASDSATITMRLYDNLPFQRQPIASDVAAYTQTVNTAGSDFSFAAFQFISGHADANPARWHFSNVAFAQNAGEASDYILAHPASSLPSVVQVGSGGTTVPGTWTSGAIVSNAIVALTVIPAKFGDLYDSSSGLVGGGAVAGDLYYAFTARSLDRAGDTLLPSGSTSYSPYSPANAFGGGQLVGTAPSLGLGQGYGHYALSYFMGVNGGNGGTKGDINPRIDMAPARVMLYDVRIHFNASAADTAAVVMYTYDNLPSGQLQPLGTNSPTYTRQATISGDFAFNAFQFISGHADANPARWRFSNVVFTRNATTAADYILNPPAPPHGTLLRFY